jgi:FkbM family methyltransferase
MAENFKLIKKIMIWIKKQLRHFYDRYIRRDAKAIAYHDYQKCGGEKLRLKYPLKQDSIVIDVGGYLGDFSIEIAQKFGCNIDIFEPVAIYADKIRKRFATYENVKIIQAGLGANPRNIQIRVNGLGSSVFNDDMNVGSKEKIRIISVVDYLKERSYNEISLLKINIEGGEYELLDSILSHSELIESIRFLQIQFHDFVPNAYIRRVEIQNKLSNTHKKMWDFPFIWESWKLKSNE